MSIEKNKIIASRVLQEVFIDGNLSAANELIDPGYIYHGAGGRELRGIEGILKDAAMISAAVPDRHGIFEDQIAEGDKVVTRFTFSGTHTGGELFGIAPAGNKFAISGIIITLIKNGKVAESHPVGGLRMLQKGFHLLHG